MIDKHVTDLRPQVTSSICDARQTLWSVSRRSRLGMDPAQVRGRSTDEEAAQEENRQEVREMLARWKAHGSSFRWSTAR